MHKQTYESHRSPFVQIPPGFKFSHSFKLRRLNGQQITHCIYLKILEMIFCHDIFFRKKKQKQKTKQNKQKHKKTKQTKTKKPASNIIA